MIEPRNETDKQVNLQIKEQKDLEKAIPSDIVYMQRAQDYLLIGRKLSQKALEVYSAEGLYIRKIDLEVNLLAEVKKIINNSGVKYISAPKRNEYGDEYKINKLPKFYQDFGIAPESCFRK